MLGKLFGRNDDEKAKGKSNARELEKVKQRVVKVERRVGYLETQLGLMKPPEEVGT